MKGLVVLFPVLFLFLGSFFGDAAAAQGSKNGVYIVYMGAAASGNGSLRDDHAQLLAFMLKWKKNSMIRSYKHGFSGFAARLSEEEAHALSKKPGVVSIFPDPVLKLHTTRSWDFLKIQTDVLIDSVPSPSLNSQDQESDTIIGILDTGVWPESESFNDKDMGPIPTRWKGTCNAGNDNVSFSCNRKIIGARFYDIEDDVVAKGQSPRDMVGHGTHVASTAAGQAVQGASYYGLAAGTAIGGSPGSRIAVYRVCSPVYGCTGSNILAAFDDAIADGVDVLSLSLGGSAGIVRPLTDDPIALGAFHAVEHGITVVCSAGNDGPSSGSVVNFAPWIFTVAASTIDRDFESDIVLGGNKVIKGESINFSNLQKSPVYPLIYAKSAKKDDANENAARNCDLDSLAGALVKGKIVLCDNDDDMGSVVDKKDGVKSLGGVGVIVIDDQSRAVASSYGTFPLTVISSKEAAEILAYINSTSNPVATILPTVSVTKYKPAPAIAYFSARGPSPLTRNILKPDITAPGVNILAAWMGNDTGQAPEGKEPPLFNVISGTSMSCPHISGVVAAIKHQNPTFSPSEIKSAVMTTATQTNNLRAPMTTNSGAAATPYDFGAGEVSTTASLQPGLVYETTTLDYLNFLCYYGYDLSKIKMIATTIPKDFACPKDSGVDSISNINYPSIAVSSFDGKEGRTISRRRFPLSSNLLYGLAKGKSIDIFFFFGDDIYFSIDSFTFQRKNMSGRNRGPPLPMKGAPPVGLPLPVHEPQFGRGLGPMPPHPALLEEMRETQFGMGPRPLPPTHPAIIEEHLAAQHQDIQGLLADNQRLAATHVALKQELEVAQYELQRMVHYADSFRMDKDVQMREMYDKSVQLEVDLRGVEAMRSELLKVQADIKELTAVRQELTGQAQMMSQDLVRLTADLQQVPALKAEIENVKQELQRARAAIEFDKKGYAENYEHGQVMEKKLISMARELEKLRAEIANSEKRARAAAAVGNSGASFNTNYGTPEAGYPSNPYPVSYSMNPVQAGAETYPHYGPGPGSWGAYDMQRAQGHR